MTREELEKLSEETPERHKATAERLRKEIKNGKLTKSSAKVMDEAMVIYADVLKRLADR